MIHVFLTLVFGTFLIVMVISVVMVMSGYSIKDIHKIHDKIFPVVGIIFWILVVLSIILNWWEPLC